MASVLPSSYRELALSAPEAVFAKADYIAKDDPLQPGRHIELQGDILKIPDSATSFSLICDRTGFKSEIGLAIKCRAQIWNGKDWQLLIAFTTDGGQANDPLGNVITRSGGVVELPAGTERLVRTQFVPIQNINAAVTVEVR